MTKMKGGTKFIPPSA